MTDACGNILHGLDENQSVEVTSPIGSPVWAEVESSSYPWQWQVGLASNLVSGSYPNETIEIPGGVYEILFEVDSESQCGSGGNVQGIYTVNYAKAVPTIELRWDRGRGWEPAASSMAVAPGGAVGSRMVKPVVWRVRPGDSGSGDGGARYADVPIRAYVASPMVHFDWDGNITEHLVRVEDTAICTGIVHRFYDPDTMSYPGQVTASCTNQHQEEAEIAGWTELEGSWVDDFYDGDIGVAVGVSRAPSRPGRYYLVLEPAEGPIGDMFRRDHSWEIDSHTKREFYVLPMDLEVQYLAEDVGPTPHEINPGAGVVVNADDDDGDGTPDHLQTTAVAGEDNLIPARIVLDESLLEEGEAVLTRSGNQIKVWSDPEKNPNASVLTDDSVSEKVWDLADPDDRSDFETVRDNLWIEGNVGSINPRDVELSFTYRTDNSEGTDTVLLSAIPLELSVFPEEPIEISADHAEAYLVAGVLIPTLEDPTWPAEDGTKVNWALVAGEDGLLEDGATTTEYGYTSTTLFSARARGSSYTARASVSEIAYDGMKYEIGDFEESTASITVAAGDAASVFVEPLDLTYAADSTSNIRLTATAEDAHGNFVEAGTPVDWDLNGLGAFDPEDIEEVTDADGKARVTIFAGFLEVPQHTLVQVDGYGHNEIVENDPIEITLESELASMEVCSGQQSTLIATFRRPNGDPIADGTPVHWFTSSGTLLSPESSTYAGTAVAVLDSTHGKITEGLTESTVVSVTLKNFTKAITIPFYSSEEQWIAVRHPVIIGSLTEDDKVGIEQIDGSLKYYDYYTKTDAHIRGAPFQEFEVAPIGGIQSSLFALDGIENGFTIDGVTLEAAFVEGAEVDSWNFVEGSASFKFEGSDWVTVSDNAAYDFEEGFSFSAWVNPASVDGGTIIDKPGEFALAVDAAGFVVFSVATDDGSFEVTSDVQLEAGDWQLVDAEYIDGRARVSVGRKSSSVIATGSPAGGAADLTIGSGFVGNIDNVSVQRLSAGSSYLEIDGVDVNHRITLDANGEAVLVIRSTGNQQTPLMRHTIRAAPVADAKSDTLKTSPSLACLFSDIFSLEEPSHYGHFVNLFDGFVTGQGEGFAGLAGDVVAGVLIWGDLRDCAVQGVRALHPNKEADWAVFGFAAGGLLLELAPGAGDTVDSVLAAVKGTIRRLPDGPMRDIVAEIPLHLALRAHREGWESVANYADELWQFFDYLFKDLTPAQVQRWAEFIRSSDQFEIALRVFRETCGGSKSYVKGRPCFDWFERVSEEFPAVGGRFLEVFDGLDESVRLMVRESEDASRGLARLLDHKVDSDLIEEALICSQAYDGSLYTPAKLLEDANKLVEKSPELPPSHITQQLKEISESVPTHYHGYTLEFRAATHITDVLGDRIIDLKGYDGVGLDCIGQEFAYQVKRSASALVGPPEFEDLKKTEAYLRYGMDQAEEIGKQYRLALPEGVKGQFSDEAKSLLQELNLYDNIIEIPDFYPSTLKANNG
jgi:hypothetical protein